MIDTDQSHHPMMDAQIDLEAEMRDVTRARYYRLHEKAEEREDLSDTHVGRNVFDFSFEPFFQALQEWSDERNSGKAGRRSNVVTMLNEFDDLKTLGYLFVRHLINTTLTLRQGGKIKACRMTRVALVCAGAIHDEYRMRYFEENRKALLKKIVKDFQQRDLPRRRRRELMIKQFHTQQLEWEAPGWNQSNRLKLGVTLIDIFINSTGLVEEFDHFDGPKSIRCLTFTEAMRETLADRMENAANLFTVFYPTLVPPRPWSNDALIGGGYYTDKVQPYRFVKGSKVHYLRELESRDMSRVIAPINAIQNTGWRIKPSMVEVLDAIFSMNIKVTGLPTSDPMVVPTEPPGKDEDEDIAKEYRKACYMVHDQNRRDISKRISVMRTISMARRFMDYSEIFFPMDIDSRGRAYPKVPFLNPQGPDYVKSLLEFSEGKPIETEEHAAYLAIAVANAWGQDKLPLQDRVNWTEENEVMLQEIAEDPLRDHRWMQADEPFMALRGAMEWAEFCAQGWGFMSHMPVHFDATCSGLQHFSALLRDKEGGTFVNLTGLEDRQDIYAEVARKATLSLEADASDEARIALEMGVSRALCKRPVMIVPYAGTFMACMEYVADHYRERVEDGEVLPADLPYIQTRVSPVVAKHVWDAIASTVIAARDAMDWITHVARAASKGNNAPLQWSTPDGFIVHQSKYNTDTQRVTTFLDGGRKIMLSVVHETPVLDSRKMAQSLSPNYIHSLDATHMRMAVNRADGMGMSFAMIHDSFGVHASDMAQFVEECIKPAFVDMYVDGDNLEQFRKEMMVNIKNPEEIKPMPTSGELDIHEVMDSQFFFS